MKTSMGRVLLDKDEAKEEILLMLNELHLYMKTLAQCMKRIKDHCGLPSKPNNSINHEKAPMEVVPSNSSMST